ncbi:uncharacterized protein LOC143237080 [Tachypleus tridentatus]|uniref:uncharacterized protein LOC143237017 n=1 Tax=Tachypleus tridentatus TaxID=6853 RepID=UPI003FD21DA8
MPTVENTRFPIFVIRYFLVLLIAFMSIVSSEEPHHRAPRFVGLPNSPILRINSFTGLASSLRPPSSQLLSISSPFRSLRTRLLSNGKPSDLVSKFSTDHLLSISSILSRPKHKGLSLSKLINLPFKLITNAKPYKVLTEKASFLKLV